jgi:glycosyltransferase involved in cell wall biosynthesis
MIVMVHFNPVSVGDGFLVVDRKFHEGLLRYSEALGPIHCLNPAIRLGQPIMDPVEVRLEELPYRISAIETNGDPWVCAKHEVKRVEGVIASSDLVYGWGLSSSEIARKLGVPYILILEYDLATKLQIIWSNARPVYRRAVSVLRQLWYYFSRDIPCIQGAAAVHCNGYPIYDEVRHPNKLLYFDSRMRSEDIAHPRGPHTPLRLIYSGRYERMKGADDAVKVAIEALRRGLDVEMDCYGQGNLKDEMLKLAEPHPQIRIHDAIPYPELLKRMREADVFVCCHIQGDPSCTYLEAMGSGLPIVGYANRMWRRMCEESGAGVAVPVGDIQAMVSAMPKTGGNNAVAFATKHPFEKEWSKRIDSIGTYLSPVARSESAASS